MLTLEEFGLLTREERERFCPSARCPICKEKKLPHPDERDNYRLNGMLVCKDCYYMGMGAEIEKRPIVCARVRRG